MKKKAVDDVFRAILLNLYKAFVCICCNLLVVKLYAYVLSFPALKLMQDCLCNRKQITRSGMYYTRALGRKFYLMSHKVNFWTTSVQYADDTTPYVISRYTTEL